MKKCRVCGSIDISWGYALRNGGSAPDGRLRIGEIHPVFYIGCNFCSATLANLTGNDILDILDEYAPGATGKEIQTTVIG